MDDNTQVPPAFQAPQPVPSIADMRSQHGLTSSPYGFAVIPGSQTATFEDAGALPSLTPEQDAAMLAANQAPHPGLSNPEQPALKVAESRNFTYAGETYRGRIITGGQFAAVAMSLSEGGTLMMDTLRLVVSSVVGPDTWKLMFNALASGTATVEDLVGVVRQLSPQSDG